MSLIIVCLIVFSVVWWRKSKKKEGVGADPRGMRYLKDAYLLPKLNGWDVGNRPWWPSKVLVKKNLYFEKVKVNELSQGGQPIEVGSELYCREYPAGRLIFDDGMGFISGPFSAKQDGELINIFHIGRRGTLRSAYDENRLVFIVREIDLDAKEMSVVVAAFDRPLPWQLPKGNKYAIPRRSLDKLVEKAANIEELDRLLNEWWDQRRQRQNKSAGS